MSMLRLTAAQAREVAVPAVSPRSQVNAARADYVKTLAAQRVGD